MSHSPDALALDVAVPVFNEEATLEHSVRALHSYLTAEFSVPWRITIADNASTDDTAVIAERLAAEFGEVVAVHLAEKGRGRALKTVWLASPARVVAYVDVDLSTDLGALPPLVAPLLSGHSDLAIGTRLAAGSRVVRGAKRDFISRSYNLILRQTMAVGFSDAQCGFKAITREVAQQVLPLVEDDGWFFDTELLIIAERSRLRIHEVPVDWVDDPSSSVQLASTARADLLGLVRVTRSIMTGRIPIESIYAELGRAPIEEPRRASFFGQVIRFGVIGVASTIAFALLYLLLHTVLVAQLANFAALLITAILNTGANRRFTFGVRGALGAAMHQVQGLAIFALTWGITAASLALLHAVDPTVPPQTELLVLTAANLLGTVVRFVLLRAWVFRRRRAVTAATLPLDQKVIVP